MSKLAEIQSKVKAPKDHYNKFGGFNYRNLESMLPEIKKVLGEYSYGVKFIDTMECIGERYYVKAVVQIIDADGNVVDSANGYAREAENLKGMNPGQLSGATSSYARKYAVQALFALGVGADLDSLQNENTKEKPNIDKEKEKRNKQRKKYNELIKKLPDDKRGKYQQQMKEVKKNLMGVKATTEAERILTEMEGEV